MQSRGSLKLPARANLEFKDLQCSNTYSMKASMKRFIPKTFHKKVILPPIKKQKKVAETTKARHTGNRIIFKASSTKNLRYLGAFTTDLLNCTMIQ